LTDAYDTKHGRAEKKLLNASVHQVIDMARRITGREIVARNASRWAGDPQVLVADAKKPGELFD
jgi:UDP-glucose 4-epimerase